MHKLFRMLLFIVISAFPACTLANSLEVDANFFSGSYAPAQYKAADLHFNAVGNDFGGKIFFQDLKSIDLTQLEIVAGSQRYCLRQVRGFYVNTARGNRVRPLDQDSLDYLKSIDSSYDNLTMTGGLFVCSNPSNGVVGYIQHNRRGELFSLVAGLDYDFLTNQYLPYYEGDGNFLFENEQATGYLRDSYGGIAQIVGSGLNVSSVCGDGYTGDNETCDDGNTQNNDGCTSFCQLETTTGAVCDNAIVETGEVCDDGALLNGTPGKCNHQCNGYVPAGGGGGGGLLPSTDIKRGLCEVRDCSDSYYDGICGKCTVEDIKEQTIGSTGDLLINYPDLFTDEVLRIQEIVGTRYSIELIQAYVFAKDVGITTMTDIDKADMTGTLIRSHMAKMLVNYAVKLMNKKPDLTRSCLFFDMEDSSLEMQGYARMACQLGLMGLKKDGTPDITFAPNDMVTRAQFGTVLSRLLYGGKYNNQQGVWYFAHLQALNLDGIMTRISQPTMLELRGWVMLMLKRIVER